MSYFQCLLERLQDPDTAGTTILSPTTPAPVAEEDFDPFENILYERDLATPAAPEDISMKIFPTPPGPHSQRQPADLQAADLTSPWRGRQFIHHKEQQPHLPASEHNGIQPQSTSQATAGRPIVQETTSVEAPSKAPLSPQYEQPVVSPFVPEHKNETVVHEHVIIERETELPAPPESPLVEPQPLEVEMMVERVINTPVANVEPAQLAPLPAPPIAEPQPRVIIGQLHVEVTPVSPPIPVLQPGPPTHTRKPRHGLERPRSKLRFGLGQL